MHNMFIMFFGKKLHKVYYVVIGVVQRLSGFKESLVFHKKT